MTVAEWGEKICEKNGRRKFMSNNFFRLADIVKNKFSQQNILVIGDLMVDEYVTGQVSRISPEAPVPVLRYSKKSMEAGGASNVEQFQVWQRMILPAGGSESICMRWA